MKNIRSVLANGPLGQFNLEDLFGLIRRYNKDKVEPALDYLEQTFGLKLQVPESPKMEEVLRHVPDGEPPTYGGDDWPWFTAITAPRSLQMRSTKAVEVWLAQEHPGDKKLDFEVLKDEAGAYFIEDLLEARFFLNITL